jgi:hypothetical protein
MANASLDIKEYSKTPSLSRKGKRRKGKRGLKRSPTKILQ